MQNVPIPDAIYAEAAECAAALGLDVNAYIVEAVQMRLERYRQRQ